MAPTAKLGTNNTTDVFISRSRASLSASLGGVMAVAWRRSAGGCSLRRVGGGLKAAAACSSSTSARRRRGIFYCCVCACTSWCTAAAKNIHNCLHLLEVLQLAITSGQRVSLGRNFDQGLSSQREVQIGRRRAPKSLQVRNKTRAAAIFFRGIDVSQQRMARCNRRHRPKSA